MKFLNGEKKLPSTAEMLRDTEIDIEERRASGLPKRKWHSMGTQRQVISSSCTIISIILH